MRPIFPARNRETLPLNASINRRWSNRYRIHASFLPGPVEEGSGKSRSIAPVFYIFNDCKFFYPFLLPAGCSSAVSRIINAHRLRARGDLDSQKTYSVITYVVGDRLGLGLRETSSSRSRKKSLKIPLSRCSRFLSRLSPWQPARRRTREK